MLGLAGQGDPWNRVGVNVYYPGGISVGSAELAYGRFEFLLNDLRGFSVGDPLPDFALLVTEDNLSNSYATFQWEDQGEGLGRVVSGLELELLVDTDGDGIPDDCGFVCESFGVSADVDDDNDDVGDEIDNCPLLANAEQSDFEGDGIGDACDSDDDGDGVSDLREIKVGTDPLDASSYKLFTHYDPASNFSDWASLANDFLTIRSQQFEDHGGFDHFVSVDSVTSGKYYWEVAASCGMTGFGVGVADQLALGQ